jgi:hypothetical protein
MASSCRRTAVLLAGGAGAAWLALGRGTELGRPRHERGGPSEAQGRAERGAGERLPVAAGPPIAAPPVPPAPVPPAPARDRESPALRIATSFLQLVGVLGLGLTAAGAYLRKQELEAAREARRFQARQEAEQAARARAGGADLLTDLRRRLFG